MAASLKNVIKTNQIRLNISIRMRDGISHASLSGKIHHNGRAVLLEYIIYCVFICQISFDESEPFIMRELVKAIFLKTHIVIIIYIIETDNMNPFNRIKQLLARFEPMNPAAPVTSTAALCKSIVFFISPPRHPFAGLESANSACIVPKRTDIKALLSSAIDIVGAFILHDCIFITIEC